MFLRFKEPLLPHAIIITPPNFYLLMADASPVLSYPGHLYTPIILRAPSYLV